MRCDQLMGLNGWARNFVKGEPVLVCVEEVTRVYPDGSRETLEPLPVYESSVKKEESDEFFTGMFEELYSLNKYIFPDGRVYFEEVQSAPWSSGPVFFLALKNADGNWVLESLWGEAEIAAEVSSETTETETEFDIGAEV